MAACRERPVAAWGIPAIPVEAKLGLIPLMPPAPANAARFWKIKTNNQNKFIHIVDNIDLTRKNRARNWIMAETEARLGLIPLMPPAPANAARFWKIKTNPLITLDLTGKNGWNRILAETEA